MRKVEDLQARGVVIGKGGKTDVEAGAKEFAKKATNNMRDWVKQHYLIFRDTNMEDGVSTI